MFKFAYVCVAIALVAGFALTASAEMENSSGTSYDTGSSYIDGYLNNYLNHGHATYIDEPRLKTEIGVDWRFFEFSDSAGFEVQPRWDVSNEDDYSVAVIFKLDTTD